jgi:hypothetical protein
MIIIDGRKHLKKGGPLNRGNKNGKEEKEDCLGDYRRW